MTALRPCPRTGRRLATLALCLCLPLLWPGLSFGLRLSPAMVVGDRFALDLTLEETVTSSVETDGESMVLGEGKARMALVGSFEVLAIDEWQRPTRRRLEIDRFVVGLLGEESEVLPAGAVVLVSQSTEASAAIAADGAPLPAAAARALETLFDAWSVLGVDEIFETSRPGGSQQRWPVVPEKALQALGLDDPGVVDLARIQGEVKIVGEDVMDGHPCQETRLELGFPMRDPGGEMPDEVEMLVALERDDCVPVGDAAAPRRQDERYITTLRIPVQGNATRVTRQERRLIRTLRRPDSRSGRPVEYL